MTAHAGQLIPCRNCEGRGYIQKLTGAGYTIPVVCRGCNGAGTQRVQP